MKYQLMYPMATAKTSIANTSKNPDSCQPINVTANSKKLNRTYKIAKSFKPLANVVMSCICAALPTRQIVQPSRMINSPNTILRADTAGRSTASTILFNGQIKFSKTPANQTRINC